MVKTLKKAGWVRSTLVLIGVIFTLVASVWTAHGHLTSTTRGIVDERIELHEAESEAEQQRILEAIRTEQAIQGTKLDMIIEELGDD